LWQARRLIAVNHNYRRILPTLMSIPQLDSAPPDQWRLMLRHRLLEKSRQLGRASPAESGTVGSQYRLEQTSDTATV